MAKIRYVNYARIALDSRRGQDGISYPSSLVI